MDKVVFSLPTFKESLLIEIDEAVTYIKPNGSEFQTPWRPVKGCNNLFWAVTVYPSGSVNFGETIGPFVGVFVVLSKLNVHVSAKISLLNSNVTRSFSHHYSDFVDYGFGTFITTEHLRTCGAVQNGKFTLQCEITFKTDGHWSCTVFPLNPILPYEFIEAEKKETSDADLMVCGILLKVHRGFLSMISSKFQRMFNENQVGIITIKGFKYETVKAAIDFIYGYPIHQKPMADVIDALRFMKMFDITAAVLKLESWIGINMTKQNYAIIAQYAFNENSEFLQEKCQQFFVENRVELIKDTEFLNLGKDVVYSVLKPDITPPSSADSVPTDSSYGLLNDVTTVVT